MTDNTATAPQAPIPSTTPPVAQQTVASDAMAQSSQPPVQTAPPQQPPVEHKGGWHFSKATLILIVILGGIASFFLYLALKQNTKTQKMPVAAVLPTPTPYAQSVLSFEPSQLSATQGATISPQPRKNSKILTYSVILTTNADRVNAVQLELGFDSSTIIVDDIVPGPFMPNSVQLTKDINNKTGRISYAIGVAPNDKPISGTGEVATISLEFLPTATASSTTLSFLPKTLVAGAGVNPSVLKSSTDITIPLPQPTSSAPTPLTSPSPVR